MSHAISSWAWSQKCASTSQKLVLVKLADSANDDGVCWPSLRTLERDLGMTRSTVARHVKSLGEAGFLTVEERRHADGGLRSNLYHLCGAVSGGGVPPGRDTPVPPGRDTLHRLGGTPLEPPVEPPTEPKTPGRAVARRAPNPIWDVLVELYGPPLDNDRGKLARGRIVSDVRERLIQAGFRDPDSAVDEVRRRYVALSSEWSSRATARALVENWHVAGQLAAEPKARGMSPEEIARRAVELREEESDEGV